MEGPPIAAIGAIDNGFGPNDIAFNMRDWVKSALEAKGAEITGAGMGFGGADLWFKVEGHEFFLTVKPVNK